MQFIGMIQDLCATLAADLTLSTMRTSSDKEICSLFCSDLLQLLLATVPFPGWPMGDEEIDSLALSPPSTVNEKHLLGPVRKCDSHFV
jgi:hypothetical protein